MPKPVVESAKIVIRSLDGNRLTIEGKGSATESLHTAFLCLGTGRRTALLERLQKTHAEMLAKEVEGTDHGCAAARPEPEEARAPVASKSSGGMTAWKARSSKAKRSTPPPMPPCTSKPTPPQTKGAKDEHVQHR